MKQEQKNDIQQEILASLEAILFMYGVPVKEARLCEIMDCSTDFLRKHVAALAQQYDKRGAGLTILVAHDTVQMVTHAKQADMIAQFTKKELEGDLSQAALEVLAVIAYRGPLAKPDIEAIRGVNCAFTLRNLLMRGLIERRPHPTDHRTQLYRTTTDLLRVLGITSTSELPHFDDLAGDHRIDAILYSNHSEDEGSDQAADV